MFSNATIALLFSAGFAAWVYAKIQRQTGNNTQTSIIAAVGSGLVAFLALLTILSMIS